MALILNVLISLGVAAGVGAVVHRWLRGLEEARQDGMQALAARRGWALTDTGERLGRAGTLRLVPRGGLPWTAEARPAAAAGGPATEYAAEEPRWAEGTLVMVAAALGAEGPLVLPASLLGEDAARAGGPLVAWPGPEGVTVLADRDPSRRADLAALAQAMRGFAPVARGLRGTPVLMLSPAGLRLRLGVPVRRPDRMERLLDLALELSRLIGPG